MQKLVKDFLKEWMNERQSNRYVIANEFTCEASQYNLLVSENIYPISIIYIHTNLPTSKKDSSVSQFDSIYNIFFIKFYIRG